jgi:hypothetical protein
MSEVFRLFSKTAGKVVKYDVTNVETISDAIDFVRKETGLFRVLGLVNEATKPKFATPNDKDTA